MKIICGSRGGFVAEKAISPEPETAGGRREIKMTKRVSALRIGYHEWPCGCRLWLTGFVPRERVMEHDSDVFGHAVVCHEHTCRTEAADGSRSESHSAGHLYWCWRIAGTIGDPILSGKQFPRKVGCRDIGKLKEVLGLKWDFQVEDLMGLPVRSITFWRESEAQFGRIFIPYHLSYHLGDAILKKIGISTVQQRYRYLTNDAPFTWRVKEDLPLL